MGNQSTRDRLLTKLLESPSIMVFASGVSSSQKTKIFSNRRWLSSDPNELFDRLKILPPEKQDGNTSNIIIEETNAIVEKY